MPRTKFEKFIFTILMVIVMAYGMICYNIALEMGGLSNQVFLLGLTELLIVAPVAFLLDWFIVSKLVMRKAGQMVNMERDNPIMMVLAISILTVMFMCPIMSLIVTIFFNGVSIELFSMWIEKMAFNYPMAIFWQLFFAGPFVRFVFKSLFSSKKNCCASK